MSPITLLTIIFLVLGIAFFITRLKSNGPVMSNTALMIAIAVVAMIILYMVANQVITLK